MKYDEESMYPGVRLLVQHESGNKVYGICPSSLNCKKGDMVSFVATVTPKNGEPRNLGYFKRPLEQVLVAALEVQ